MSKLKTTEALVKSILEKDARTRNNDNFLYLKVLDELDSERGTNIVGMNVVAFLSCQSELDIPSFKTVERCRRKIARSNPELAGNSEVEAFREVKETEFREYARQVMV